MTAPRQLLDRAARREAILRAAATAFASNGFAGTSMDDVAAAAGITKLIVYRHFPSKQQLYDDVLERVSERLRDEFVSQLQTGRPGAGAVRAILTVARADPDAFVLLWRHAAREPQFAEHVDAIRDRAIRAAEALLASLDLQGRIRRHWAAATIVTYLVTAVLHWLEEGTREEDEQFADMLARSLPAMIRAWAGEEPPR